MIGEEHPMFDPIEEAIKAGLEGKEKGTLPLVKCPAEAELWAYLDGSIEARLQEKIGHHVLRCDSCLSSLLLAQEVRPGIGFDPSATPSSELLTKVVSLAKKKGASKAKNRWLFLSLFSIGASFFIPRYFFQCLILGVIFGLKWIFDTTTNRTLIVMYDALKQKNHKEEETIKRP